MSLIFKVRLFYPSSSPSFFEMATDFPSYVILFVSVKFENVAQDLKLLGFYLPTIYRFKE